MSEQIASLKRERYCVHGQGEVRPPASACLGCRSQEAMRPDRNPHGLSAAIQFETPELFSQRYVQQSPHLAKRAPATIERIEDH